jgi:serine/threonine-protein kinase
VLVLKRVEGIEWHKLIRDDAEVRRRFGVTDLLAWNVGILMQVLNAVRFAHSRGIIHRDLKPHNVMIGDFGEVYLLDWGIAVSLRPDPSGRLPLAADATEVAGTPHYMAPEMLEPKGRLSERTDVYLAGAVLFEIIASRPPHDGATALAVLTSVLSSKPQLTDDAPAELAAITSRALAAEPVERYESVEAVRLALQSYLEHRGSDLLLQGAKVRLDELVATLAQSPTDETRQREAIYRLFGACRFGFHEALAVWKDNAAARDGIVRATVAVAEFELASGDAHSAVSMLSELDEPPPLIEKARVAAADQQSRKVALEKLGYAHDLEVGRISRGKLGVALGVLFTIAPLTAQWVSYFQSHFWFTMWSVTATAITGSWGWFARASLATTLVNRRILWSGVFIFAMQTVLIVMMGQLDASLGNTEIMMLFLYAVTSGMLAITVDRQLAASAIGFSLATIAAARWPADGLYILAVADFIFMLNTLISWRLAKHAASS